MDLLLSCVSCTLSYKLSEVSFSSSECDIASYVYMCTYVCTHVHVCVCTCVYVHVCVCMCVCTCVCMYVCVANFSLNQFC